MVETLGGSPIGSEMVGGRRRGASVKTLKKLLKKAGLKTTGRKAALTRRAKKAHLKMRGGVVSGPDKDGKYTSDKVSGTFDSEQDALDAEAAAASPSMGGRRRRRGRSVFSKLF